MGKSVILEKSEDFALRIVKLYQDLVSKEEGREFVLSKQLLRSGTSIGANVAEAQYAISRSDFNSKMYISLKEANESLYWLRLLYKAGYLSEPEFNSLYNDCEELLKILISITKTVKENK